MDGNTEDRVPEKVPAASTPTAGAPPSPPAERRPSAELRPPPPVYKITLDFQAEDHRWAMDQLRASRDNLNARLFYGQERVSYRTVVEILIRWARKNKPPPEWVDEQALELAPKLGRPRKRW